MTPHAWSRSSGWRRRGIGSGGDGWSPGRRTSLGKCPIGIKRADHAAPTDEKNSARLGELPTPSPDIREQEFGSIAQHEASEVTAALGVLEAGRNPASPACQERKEKE